MCMQFFPNRPLYKLEKLENVYRITLEYKISMANNALDYDMSSNDFMDILWLICQCLFFKIRS